MVNRTAKIDLSYPAYLKVLHNKMTPKGIANADLAKSNRYPKPFKGTTIITDPKDPTHSAAYQFLQKTQSILSKGNQTLMATPLSSFHMTLAGITYGEHHIQLIESGEIQKIIAAVNQVFTASGPGGFMPQFKIGGFFPLRDAIVAGLEPVDPQSYQALVELRTALFEDPVLSQFDIKDEEPVTFHVTTHYLIKNEIDRELLNLTLAGLNQDISNTSPIFFPVSYLIYTEYFGLDAFAKIKASPQLRFFR